MIEISFKVAGENKIGVNFTKAQGMRECLKRVDISASNNRKAITLEKEEMKINVNRSEKQSLELMYHLNSNSKKSNSQFSKLLMVPRAGKFLYSLAIPWD